MSPEQDQLHEATRAELLRRTDEVELLRDVLAEATGLTLTGVQELVALYRRARSLQDMEFGPEQVLAALGKRWWRTGVIARALLVNGGKGLTARQRSDHHHRVSGILEQLESEGLLERRRISEQDGHVMTRAESGRGHTEWRRVLA
jgi:hypothetical protein